MASLSNFRVTILTSVFVFISSVYGDTDDGGNIMDILIAKIDLMQAKIVKLEKSESSLKQSISALIGTTAQFRLQIADLSKRLEAYEISDKEKDERIKNLENGKSKNRDTYCAVNSDESESRQGTEGDNVLAKEVEEKKVKRGIRQTSENVAFTAYLDHVIRNLGKNQPVVYNQVLLNDGGAYSNNTGIFRVPISGVYLLSWYVTARKLTGEHAYDVWVKLVVNGAHQTGAVAESRDDADDNQGGNSAVLRLSQGDEVWTVHYSSFPDVFGDDGERTTSFMGALLYIDQ